MVILRARAGPGGRAALEEFFAGAIPFYEAPGGIRVTVEWDVADPAAFTETIAYATTRDHAADAERVRSDAAMRASLARWRSLLDGPPQVREWFAPARAPDG